MRRAILCCLYEHLTQTYKVDCPREEFLGGELSLHQIDAILAFKSDPRLNELRHAIDRLDEGSYGVCIGCKGEIGQEVLDRDPARLMCAECEKVFDHPTLPSFASHAQG